MEINSHAVGQELTEIIRQLRDYWDVPHDCPAMKKLELVREAIHPQPDLFEYTLAKIRAHKLKESSRLNRLSVQS